jgi:hypothetical protein
VTGREAEPLTDGETPDADLQVEKVDDDSVVE